MSRWPTTNSAYCLSEPIWYWQQNIDDKKKTSSKIKLKKWQLDRLHADKTNRKKKKEKISNDHVRDRSWYLRMLRTRHICTFVGRSWQIVYCRPWIFLITIRSHKNNNNNNNILRCKNQQAKYLNDRTNKQIWQLHKLVPLSFFLSLFRSKYWVLMMMMMAII
jgi:hypothetical protein